MDINEDIKNNSINRDFNVDLKEKNSKNKSILNIGLIFGILLIIFFNLTSIPSRDKDVVIHVSANDSLVKITDELKKYKVIKYPFILKIYISIISSDKKIPVGDYLFKKGENPWSVGIQLGRGIHGVDRIKVTFKEGLTNEQMADILANKIQIFRRDLFLSDERSKQGYLFPDTYFFYPLTTTDEILNELTINFKKRISTINKEIKDSGKSLSDIIIMASILEKEANGKEDSPIISGILWKRINLGMPLQVDAAPSTYKNADLPKKPISNPGLSSIMFALKPINSPYLFYLHDDSGQVHYAKDFSAHRSNIARYLK